MKTLIPLTILLLLVFAHCKKSDDGDTTSPYKMQCPSTPAHLVFSYQGAGAALPNGFSPNGDGRNDILRMIGYDSMTFKSMTLKIIDSNGKLLSTITNVYAGWDGVNAATGKAYPQGVYRIEFNGVLNGRGVVADSTIAGSNCIWLFRSHPTQPGCLLLPADNSIINYIRFADQFDPATLLAIYTTGENFCP